MDKATTEVIRKQLHELLDIVIDTNGFEDRQRDKTGTLPSVFFEFKGHINEVEVEMYENGYDRGASDRITLIRQYCEKPLSEEAIEHCRTRCGEALQNKKESDVLATDIANKEKQIEAEKESLKKMRQTLKQMEKEGR